ncbi:MAG: cysteine--tRNA ligase [Clostridia bacterium]|nr:MAG: cysteine--tRNA ligase [Clostridia bacterium]
MTIYNTLTRRKEALVPGEPGQVRMYVCGPTTYNLIHLGNARPLVVFDTFRRYLEYRGYRVTYVQNFTDIDDKIIARAAEEGLDPGVLADKYIAEYFLDAAALGVRPATVHPQVSQHIADIVAMIRSLVDKEYAYAADGNVYFAVDRFAGYGKLSRRSPEEMLVGARAEIEGDKRSPLDFALWKKAKPGEPWWESPWGPGRPGWHSECAAMALRYLGSGFDIHGGGYDLVFPHHENEIAQAESYTGQPFARYWMHNGFITVDQEKMSKSLGNFFLLREILRRFPGPVIRFYLLSTHYRHPLDFDLEGLEGSARGLARWQKTLDELEQRLGGRAGEAATSGPAHPLREQVAATRETFVAALDDDFNTPAAMAALFALVRETNSFLARSQTGDDAGTLAAVRACLKELGEQVLGVLPLAGQAAPSSREAQVVTGLVDLLLEVRSLARQHRDWAMADMIRDRLAGLGIGVEDTPGGTRWEWRG